MGSSKVKKNYLVQAWLVLTLATVFGAALAGVHVTLQPRIERNKRDETYRQVPQLIAGAKADLTEEVTVGGKDVYKAFGGTKDSPKHLGWVVKASGQGFADKIEVLIGLDVEAKTITGLYVLDQKETPGLGNKIVEASWCGQFAGKSAAKALAVTKAEPSAGEIAAVTGATVSSESVTDIVNAAVAEFRKALAVGNSPQRSQRTQRTKLKAES